MAPRQAVPVIPGEPEPIPFRLYEVVSPKCVWGAVGEVIELQLTDNQETSLLEAGTVKRATVRPAKAAPERFTANG
ncbi:hypothetical protein [Streptomyces sp. I8-5]|uniref:hypothetical protein n=1 Tax=Streptomyces sp. I8-5 TaxID=3104277 RepID=UPI003868015E